MTVSRKFCLGSPWLYLKIYTGFKTADLLLKEVVMPFTQQLKQKGDISHWFFIRYNDPDFHLRVRMYLNDTQNIGTVIAQLHNLLQPFIQNDTVWKIEYDTYNREIERYGANTMELSEQIFCFDSEAIGQILAQLPVEGGETQRWLIGLRLIDTLLTDFHYPLEEKQALLRRLMENFGKEFHITDDFRRHFGRQYRVNRTEIEQILTLQYDPQKPETALLLPIIQKSEHTKPLITAILQKQSENRLQVQLDDLLCSYIHLMLNRLFRTQQRKHELVLYDYLFRYYDRGMKRQKFG